PKAAPDVFKPVSYSGGDAGSPVIFRAQMSSDTPKAMPVGLPDGPNDPPAKKAFETLPAPKVVTGTLSIGGPCDCCPPCPTAHTDGCGLFGLRDCCGVPGNRFWFNAEALAWTFKGQPLVPLVTTGPVADGQNAGALNLVPRTVVLYGNDTV